MPWDEKDLRGFDGVEQEQQVQLLLQSDRAKGFSLAQPPLMRAALMQTGANLHEFVWSYHHILARRLVHRSGAEGSVCLIEAFRRNEELYLPQPRPYQDYIAWLKQQDLSQAETFWRLMLNGFSAPTPLPSECRE